jgi:quercetin 2,3-dioxygenase
MKINQLPGRKCPYAISAGEGDRYAFDGQLATVIARNEDTDGLLDLVIVSGGKGASFPLHSHERTHESLYVLDGTLELELDGRTFGLTRGDFANIPPRSLHGYTMTSHRTQILWWAVDGDSTRIYAALGSKYDGYVHPADSGTDIPGEKLGAAEKSADIQFSGSGGQGSSAWVTLPPPGKESYVLGSGEGERMLAGNQLFAFLAHQGNSDGKFISLTTVGPKGDKIPEHYHEKHTETFFCLDGLMTMWTDGEELALCPGDFLHVPAGTIHAFRLDAHYTRFIGVLAPGLFEPFFRTLCDPYRNYIFPQQPWPFRFDRVLKKLPELDLKLVGGPPGGGPPR